MVYAPPPSPLSPLMLARACTNWRIYIVPPASTALSWVMTGEVGRAGEGGWVGAINRLCFAKAYVRVVSVGAVLTAGKEDLLDRLLEDDCRHDVVERLLNSPNAPIEMFRGIARGVR